MSKFVVTSTLIIAIGAIGTLQALEDTPKRDKSDSKRTTAQSSDSAATQEGKDSTKNPDNMFATCIATGNHEEIVLAELARTKAQSEDVKAFAELMIKDHHSFLVKLNKFAPEATRPGFLNSDQGGTEEDVNAKKDKNIRESAPTEKDLRKSTQARRTEGVPDSDNKGKDPSRGGIDFMQLQQELANQCLALSKAKLEEHEGDKFDECFMGQQIGMHMGMKAKLMVFQRHASPELAGILAEGLKTTETHLAKAEELKKNLGQKTTTTNAKTREVKRNETKANSEKVPADPTSKSN